MMKKPLSNRLKAESPDKQDTTSLDKVEVLDKKLDLAATNLRPVKSKSVTKNTSKAGAISIVNCKNGKRLTFSKEVLGYLNNPNTLQFSFFDKGLVIAENLPDNDNSFVIKETGNQSLIYSAPLVLEITEAFELDFTGRTSITFHEVSYITHDDLPIVMVSIP